jgi:hypothetical protein
MKELVLNEIVRLKNLMNINEAITNEIAELRKIIRGLSIAENEKNILRKFFEGAHFVKEDEKALLEISKKPGNVLEYIREKIEALPDGITKDAAKTKLDNLENKIKAIESSGIHDFDELRIFGTEKLLQGAEKYIENNKKYFSAKEIDILNDFYKKIDLFSEKEINSLRLNITQKNTLQNIGFAVDKFIKDIDIKINEAKKIKNQALANKLADQKQQAEGLQQNIQNIKNVASTATNGLSWKRIIKNLVGFLSASALLGINAAIPGATDLEYKGLSSVGNYIKSIFSRNKTQQSGGTPQSGITNKSDDVLIVKKSKNQ